MPKMFLPMQSRPRKNMASRQGRRRLFRETCKRETKGLRAEFVCGWVFSDSEFCLSHTYLNAEPAVRTLNECRENGLWVYTGNSSSYKLAELYSGCWSARKKEMVAAI